MGVLMAAHAAKRCLLSLPFCGSPPTDRTANAAAIRLEVNAVDHPDPAG